MTVISSIHFTRCNSLSPENILFCQITPSPNQNHSSMPFFHLFSLPLNQGSPLSTQRKLLCPCNRFWKVTLKFWHFCWKVCFWHCLPAVQTHSGVHTYYVPPTLHRSTFSAHLLNQNTGKFGLSSFLHSFPVVLLSDHLRICCRMCSEGKEEGKIDSLLVRTFHVQRSILVLLE